MKKELNWNFFSEDYNMPDSTCNKLTVQRLNEVLCFVIANFLKL